MTVVEQVLIAASVVGMLVVVTTGVLTVLVLRAVRRRYRSARERLRGFRASSPNPGSTRVPGSATLSAAGSPAWWAAQNRRHRMWRAVSSAEHSVGLARRSEVAVGDLPALTAQLTAAAEGVDAVLRASARSGSLREEDRAACDRITAAAADIHAAALTSLRSASRADTDPLVSAVQIEVAALAAGVRAAHH
jgi:hypothetical protein